MLLSEPDQNFCVQTCTFKCVSFKNQIEKEGNASGSLLSERKSTHLFHLKVEKQKEGRGTEAAQNDGWPAGRLPQG